MRHHATAHNEPPVAVNAKRPVDRQTRHNPRPWSVLLLVVLVYAVLIVAALLAFG